MLNRGHCGEEHSVCTVLMLLNFMPKCTFFSALKRKIVKLNVPTERCAKKHKE